MVGAEDGDENGIDIELATTAGVTPTTRSTQAEPAVVSQPSDRVVVAAAPVSAAASGPALGRLGRYVLEKPLGRGGMAEVFLAKQEG